jgi:ribose transport system permease protein
MAVGRLTFPSSGAIALAAWRVLKRSPVWLLLALLVVFFSVQSPFFLTVFNLSNVLYQAALIGFIAVGLTPVLINGNVDLSVGAMVALSACLAVGMQESVGFVPALLVAVLSCTALGLLNGTIAEVTGVNSFIVTLAAMSGIRGLAFLYAGDTSLSAPTMDLMELGMLSVGPLSVTAIVFVALVLVFHVMLTRTAHGRDTYAVGGNRAACENAGVHVQRNVLVNFALSGTMAGVAGVSMAAQLGAATPSYGAEYELWAIIAIVLGGTSLMGGRGTVIGTFGAVLALAVLRNGLNLIQVSGFFVLVILGLTLIVALVLDRHFNRREAT